MIYRHGEAELYAVPAIHFNHVFAECVNRICHDHQTRPEAVAVELGPRACGAVEQWLRELTRTHRSLPAMLGLVKRNKIIRASMRQKALQLQKDIGKDLCELSPQILKRELGFNGYSLLCLSPPDSIIEAIRSAVELDIPVFGIDLDDMADGIYDVPIHIQDLGMAGNLASYIEKNAGFAGLQRDEEIDRRRETAMAARLKSLLKRYRKVVFTCGMAHWLNLRGLLNDDSIKPALMPEVPERREGEFRRVIVHPALAVQYMDLFPAIAIKYEKSRISGSLGVEFSRSGRHLNTSKAYHGQLKRACKKYFHGKPRFIQRDRRIQDMERLSSFEAYLRNLCILGHSSVPHLSMIAKAAQEMMSADFAHTISDTFMRYPWASPADFPDYPLLSASSENPGAVRLMEDGRGKEKDGYLRDISGNKGAVVPEISYEWKEEKKQLERLNGWTSHTWRPWDYLLTSMSLRAIEAAAKVQTVRKAVPFEGGSMLEGLDIKSTVRAYARGDERFYIRDMCRENKEYIDSPNLIDRFPIVWLFGPGNNGTSEWIVLHEPCSYMEPYVRDGAFFERIKADRGHSMVATIAYGTKRITANRLLGNSSVSCDRYHGMVVFQPISFTNRQFALYSEMRGYHNRSPFCNFSYLGNGIYSDLASYYSETHGIRVGEFHWATTMILLALPFARDVLVVVTPEDYRIDMTVYRKARRYGVEICQVPHRLFSRGELDRLPLCYLVPATSIDPECIYSKAVEKTIGELQTDNRHLVPQWLLDFGNEV